MWKSWETTSASQGLPIVVLAMCHTYSGRNIALLSFYDVYFDCGSPGKPPLLKPKSDKDKQTDCWTEN